MNKCPLNMGNTVSTGTELILFGNKIAYWTKGNYVIIRTAGWNSVTTRERLNAIPGVRVTQRDFQLYLNGREWDGNDVAVINN